MSRDVFLCAGIVVMRWFGRGWRSAPERLMGPTRPLCSPVAEAAPMRSRMLANAEPATSRDPTIFRQTRGLSCRGGSVAQLRCRWTILEEASLPNQRRQFAGSRDRRSMPRPSTDFAFMSADAGGRAGGAGNVVTDAGRGCDRARRRGLRRHPFLTDLQPYRGGGSGPQQPNPSRPPTQGRRRFSPTALGGRTRSSSRGGSRAYRLIRACTAFQHRAGTAVAGSSPRPAPLGPPHPDWASRARRRRRRIGAKTVDQRSRSCGAARSCIRTVAARRKGAQGAFSSDQLRLVIGSLCRMTHRSGVGTGRCFLGQRGADDHPAAVRKCQCPRPATKPHPDQMHRPAPATLERGERRGKLSGRANPPETPSSPAPPSYSLAASSRKTLVKAVGLGAKAYPDLSNRAICAKAASAS